MTDTAPRDTGWRMEKRALARNLKRWRQMQGISQQDVAARLGVTPAAYSHWENGRTELRVADLVRIAFALAMPLGTLMRALDLPIEERVLSPGQWLDAGRPAPVASDTIPASAPNLATPNGAGNAASEAAKRQLPRAYRPFPPVLAAAAAL